MKRRHYAGRKVERALDIEDLRLMARRRLPGFVYEYLAGGAETEVTLHGNSRSYDAIRFAHRALVDVGTRDLSRSLLGKPAALPCAIAPTGFNGLYWKRADTALARAAARHDIPFTVSTVSTDTLEQIARDAGGRLWFQLYVLREAAAAARLVERAEAAGCEALLLTVDAPVMGNRIWDARNYSAPLALTWRAKLDVLTHLRWLFKVFLPRGIAGFGNLSEFLPPERQNALDGARYMGENSNASLSWDDVARLRERWPRKFLVKGLIHPADVARAAAVGADGVVLSNHGGRQLDGDVGTIDALPRALEAAAGRLSVFLDGGIRRGSDIAKAIAVGAEGVLLGRATLYGVAAGGETGAVRALDILRGELDRTLALLGCARVADLSREYLWSADDPESAVAETLDVSRRARAIAD